MNEDEEDPKVILLPSKRENEDEDTRKPVPKKLDLKKLAFMLDEDE